ncbi:hypothetical protein EDC04DRAFT_2889110 [Pisolithus marmoratus]|nr:hypothetical protein EDC04DRAFT_2889110 [Pisolithus marmoratus]
MHACLRITEILDLIMGFMVDDERVNYPNEARPLLHKDIARLARTCKVFMDPALDVLWRTQPSLSPLIMCLPDHLWTSKLESSGRTVSLLQEPSHEDWIRPKRYSQRIRAFDHCTPLALPKVSMNAFDAVFSLGLCCELFPSLRTLDVEVFGLPSINPIEFLGSIRLPQLTRLSFRIPKYLRYKYPVFRFVPACMPPLQALTINADGDAFARRWTPALFGVDFAGVPYLRSLDLSFNMDVSSSCVRELIHLQYLRDLSVSLPGDFDVGIRPSIQPILPSLQRLEVIVGSINQCSTLLSSVTSSALGSVKIYHRAPATQSDIYTLFETIERIYDRFLDFHTLYVDFHTFPTTRSNDPTFDFRRSTLTPLLACHRLRILHLVSFGTLDIDDAFIGHIILAWPRIECLYLRGFQLNKTCVTLEGLRELLKGCPLLSSLSMQIDASILPEQEPEMESLSLTRLYIFGSRVEDRTAVERYLRILAPRLQSLMLEMNASLHLALLTGSPVAPPNIL